MGEPGVQHVRLRDPGAAYPARGGQVHRHCQCLNHGAQHGWPRRSCLCADNPGKYKSASAFAPICHPTGCPWGEKAFNGYLGSVEAGQEYDASLLVKSYDGPKLNILSDQGGADSFLTGDVDQLQPATLVDGAKDNANIALNSRSQEGYDHSY